MNNVPVPQQVLDWLFKVLQPTYKDPKSTFHDVVQVLAHFKLRPRTRVFTFPDGSSALLLSLYGTLQGVPIVIWVPKTYPETIPYVYLDIDSIPNHQKLSVNQYMDSNGKFYLPIFSEWKGTPGTMLKLTQQLLEIWKTAYPLVNNIINASNVPPIPAKVPKPSNPTVTKLVDNNLENREEETRKPEIPAKPISLQPISTNFKSHEQNIPPKVPIRPFQSTVEYSAPNSPSPPKIPPRDYESTNPGITSPTGKTPHALSHKALSPPISQKEETSFTFTLPPDLIDDFIDVNPNSSHNELLDALRGLIEKLTIQDSKELHTNIRRHEQHIKAVLDKYSSHLGFERNVLLQLRQTLQDNTEIVTEEIKQLDMEIKKAQLLENELDPALIAIPETPAFVQLYNLVAKDHALHDAIEVVSQLFHRKKISITMMVRKTRELSSEQFKTRYLISRITALLD